MIHNTPSALLIYNSTDGFRIVLSMLYLIKGFSGNHFHRKKFLRRVVSQAKMSLMRKFHRKKFLRKRSRR